MYYEDSIEINELTVGILALESSLILDMFSDGDSDDVAVEAEFSKVKDKDTKAQSYSAKIGNKIYYDQISKNDTFRRKMGYTFMKIWRAMLVGIINFFKAMANGMRKLLQIVLIPMNALIMAATGTPETQLLAGFTKEQKQAWSVLSKRSQREISDVGRDILKIIEYRVDKVTTLTEKVSNFTQKVVVNARDYNMKNVDGEEPPKKRFVFPWLSKFAPLTPEERKFRDLCDEWKDNKDEFDDEEKKLNDMLNQVERSRESIRAEAAKLGSHFYKEAVLRYMFITKEECSNAIRKCKDLVKFSNDRIKECERLQQCEGVSEDAKAVAELYRMTASLSNRVTNYFGTTISKFGVKTKIGESK